MWKCSSQYRQLWQMHSHTPKHPFSPEYKHNNSPWHSPHTMFSSTSPYMRIRCLTIQLCSGQLWRALTTWRLSWGRKLATNGQYFKSSTSFDYLLGVGQCLIWHVTHSYVNAAVWYLNMFFSIYYKNSHFPITCQQVSITKITEKTFFITCSCCYFTIMKPNFIIRCDYMRCKMKFIKIYYSF